MNEVLYWHAPVWEIVLVVGLSLLVLGWLVLRAFRSPNLGVTLSTIEPSLKNQPIFFFNRFQGLVSLSSAAHQLLNEASDSEQRAYLNLLVDACLESLSESRVVIKAEWPDKEQTLIVTPILDNANNAVGALAIVSKAAPLEPADDSGVTVNSPDQVAGYEAFGWMALGHSLYFHATRPLVRVRRSTVTNSGAGRSVWQEHSLSHTEENMLRYLLGHKSQVQQPEVLFKLVWPEDEVEEYGLRSEQKDRLRRLIYQIRQQIEPDPRNPRHLCTVHGVGYILYLDEEARVDEVSF